MSAQIITHPREQLRQLRAKMADAVERLIAAMDEIDGDPDIEPSGDENETSLATMDGRNHVIDFAGDTDDREVECEDEGHDSDTELNGDEGDNNADDEDNIWIVTPFALNQEGTKWAFGEGPTPPFF